MFEASLPRAYRYAVLLGFGATAATAGALALTGDPDDVTVPVVAGLAGAVLILAGSQGFTWWWLFGRQPDPAAGLGIAPGAGDAGRIEGWLALAAEMATEPFDAGEQVQALAEMRARLRRQLSFLAIGSALTVALGGASVLLARRISNPEALGGGAAVAQLAMLRLAAPLGRRAVESWTAAGQALLAPLGLRTTELPKTKVVGGPGSFGFGGARARAKTIGETVISGMRHDREVRIALGTEHRTLVRAPGPRLEIRGDRRGRLLIDKDAPAQLGEAIAGLAPSPVWKGVRVRRGGEGVVVIRRPGSRGGWLWDLWLAERLAAKLSAG